MGAILLKGLLLLACMTQFGLYTERSMNMVNLVDTSIQMYLQNGLTLGSVTCSVHILTYVNSYSLLVLVNILHIGYSFLKNVIVLLCAIVIGMIVLHNDKLDECKKDKENADTSCQKGRKAKRRSQEGNTLQEKGQKEEQDPPQKKSKFFGKSGEFKSTLILLDIPTILFSHYTHIKCY